HRTIADGRERAVDQPLLPSRLHAITDGHVGRDDLKILADRQFSPRQLAAQSPLIEINPQRRVQSSPDRRLTQRQPAAAFHQLRMTKIGPPLRKRYWNDVRSRP